jgi:hypothetical protein
VLGLAGPGESVGDAEALENGSYDADAFALTETVVDRAHAARGMLAALERSGRRRWRWRGFGVGRGPGRTAGWRCSPPRPRSGSRRR